MRSVHFVTRTPRPERRKHMNLKPGQSIKVSEYNGIVVTAERSGKGDVIRYVRTFADGSWEVFKTVRA